MARSVRLLDAAVAAVRDGGVTGQYSLAGVRQATTGPQEAFIAKATEVLSADDRVLAAYLVGGFAVGIGDAFSDVDLQVIVADTRRPGLAESWVELIHRIVPTGLDPQPRRLRRRGGGLCITPDWLHFDVVFHAASRSTPTPSSAWSPSSTRPGCCRRSRCPDPTVAPIRSIRRERSACSST